MEKLKLNKKTVKKLNQLEMQIVKAGKMIMADTDVTDCASSCCESGRTCDDSNGGDCTCDSKLKEL